MVKETYEQVGFFYDIPFSKFKLGVPIYDQPKPNPVIKDSNLTAFSLMGWTVEDFSDMIKRWAWFELKLYFCSTHQLNLG